MSRLPKIRTDKRGQVAGGFLEHPIVYVIILFGLAAIIGSVMMMIVAETDDALPSSLEFGSITGESWSFDSCDSGTYTKTLTHDSLDGDSVSVYNSTYTYIEDTDYSVNYDGGTITNTTTGGLIPTPITNENWRFNGSDNTTFTKQLNNTNICSGSVVITNATTTFALNIDYLANYSLATLTNMSTGSIGGFVDFVNYTDNFTVNYTDQYAETLSVDYDYTAGKWGTSYSNVVSGVQLGFSMYQLVALMGIMSIILPMLFLMFSRRRET